MRLQITHETTYAYSPAVKTAQHVAHLRPRETGSQSVLGHALEIDPAPARRTEATDAWGNRRVFFSLQQAHAALRVVARSLVETTPRSASRSTLAWDEVRERMRYHREAAYDPAAEFVFPSTYVPRDDRFVAFAQPSFPPGRPLLEAARDLAHRIHEQFEYHAEATDASTPALEALALRQGVCQDFAHVMLGCLRSLGLPARYVSGYLLTDPPPGQPRLVGSDASHAWVSVYAPSEDPATPGIWTDLDPTNDRAAGEDYVDLAVGRDYADVSPVRGVIHGAAQHALHVAVTVTPVDDRMTRPDGETP